MPFMAPNTSGRAVLKQALSPLLKVSMATGTAICRPDYGISLQALPEEQQDVFALVCATLRIDPISEDHFRCSHSATADFPLNLLDPILNNFAPDEGNLIVSVKDYDDEIFTFAFGDFEGDILRTRYLPRVSNEMEIAIDDSDFEYAVLVGIASEDFRRIIRHFRDLSPFVEAFVTEEKVTFRFGPEEIVLRTEDGNCVIRGINGFHRVFIRLGLLNADSLLEASELSTSVWMFKSCDWPDATELSSSFLK